MLKIKYTDLKQFQYDYEQKQIDYFKELEDAINEVDLSDETKQHLIDLMYKDINILFGFVEEKVDNFCDMLEKIED